MHVDMIAHTTIDGPMWDTMSSHLGTASSPEILTEFAGRACYGSWHRPNPETAKTRDYVEKNAVGKAHESILEHASATFYITGVSRSLTHELIRHRHLSFSELSQRYVDTNEVEFVMPPLVRDSMAAMEPESTSEQRHQHFQEQGLFDYTRCAYRDSYDELTEVGTKIGSPLSRKRAREAARMVMPNATETRIVVTGNLRAWRNVLKLRGSLHADAEIRELAVELHRQLAELAPSAFIDVASDTADDGRVYLREREASDDGNGH